MQRRIDFNRSLVLGVLLAGSRTVPNLARLTGYSRPTVDAIISELTSEKLIEIAGVAESSGGRRAQLYSISKTGRTAIGIAVAIPKISAVLVDLGGTVLAEKEISIPLWCPADAFISHLEKLCGSLVVSVPDWPTFAGIGVAVPGIVDSEKGVSIFFSRLSTFYNTPIKSMLEERLNLKVELSRYLGTAAIADLYTNHKNINSPVLYIELGEGIEMAIISDGKPYRGAMRNEGALGHMVIEAGGRTCLCGGKGCLEAYASNRVLMDEALLRIRNGEKSILPVDREIDDADFYQAVKQGDSLVTEVATKGLEYLSMGIANVVNILNPGTVIVSGALAGAGENFLNKLKDRIRSFALSLLSSKLDIRFLPFELRDGARGVAMSRIYSELNISNLSHI
jgi:predicted NBD/HSP70 family sugar kinase